MWNTFIPDLLVALLGSLVTVAIAYMTFSIQRRRQEHQAIRGLINDIHRRRALTVIGVVRRIRRAKRLPDFHRATASVLDLRDRVRETRNAVRADSIYQNTLTNMTRSCNRYLEATGQSANDYYFELAKLRADLLTAVQTLAKGTRSISYLEPGAGAY
jgi:hypothetical protein